MERNARNSASEVDNWWKGIEEGKRPQVRWLSQDLTHNYIVRIVTSTHSAYYVAGVF